MRIARTIRLLGLLLGVSSCASHEGISEPRTGFFKYRSAEGKTAILDVGNLTVTTDSEVIQFSDCGNIRLICWRSPAGEIVVPLKCSGTDAHNAYIESSGNLKLLSLDGLTGNIWKEFQLTGKFAYAYHLENGIVEMILFPEDVAGTVRTRRDMLSKYSYRLSGSKGPFACAS